MMSSATVIYQEAQEMTAGQGVDPPPLREDLLSGGPSSEDPESDEDEVEEELVVTEEEVTDDEERMSGHQVGDLDIRYGTTIPSGPASGEVTDEGQQVENADVEGSGYPPPGGNPFLQGQYGQIEHGEDKGFINLMGSGDRMTFDQMGHADQMGRADRVGRADQMAIVDQRVHAEETEESYDPEEVDRTAKLLADASLAKAMDGVQLLQHQDVMEERDLLGPLAGGDFTAFSAQTQARPQHRVPAAGLVDLMAGPGPSGDTSWWSSDQGQATPGHRLYDEEDRHHPQHQQESFERAHHQRVSVELTSEMSEL